MEHGDLTLIGEKGVSRAPPQRHPAPTLAPSPPHPFDLSQVTISGGQRARISLARAVYGHPPLLLLDDPLSAVDQNVARQLVDELLLGLLRREGATVLLVSHQVQYAAEVADWVVVMEGGRMRAVGRPHELAGEPSLALAATGSPAQGGEKGGETGGESSDVDMGDAKPTQEPSKVREDGEKGGVVEVQAGGQPKRLAALRFFLSLVGYASSAGVLLLFVGLGVCRALTDWALGAWIRDGQSERQGLSYTALTCATVGLGLLQAASFADRSIAGASRAHSLAARRVLRAPKAWFDVTPLGGMLSLFSRELDVLDDMLPVTTINLLKCICIVTAALLVAAAAVPAVLAALPPLLLLLSRYTRFYGRTAGQLKRLDKESSGPVYSLFAETLLGLTSVRAFRLTSEFENRMIARLSLHHAAHFYWQAHVLTQSPCKTTCR